MRPATCREVQRGLEEGKARVPELRAHLASCSSCRAHAALLDALASVPAPAADEESVDRVMAALPPASWRRRRSSAWLPLAAALAFLAVGSLLVGVPAPGAVAVLPGVAGGLAAGLASAVPDAGAALRGGADAVQAMLAADTATGRMRAIVRKAQRNFQFAVILEQRRTTSAVIEGFRDLRQAVDSLGDRIVAAGTPPRCRRGR